MKVTIQQFEPSLAQELETPLKAALKKLGRSIPDGLQLRVALEYATGRKKRSNADASTWSPDSEPIKIWFEPSLEARRPRPESSPEAEIFSSANTAETEASRAGASAGVQVHPAEAELLKALDRAESTPGWSFVSLKKFRDEILPLESTPSIRSDVERQNVLRSAIEKRLVLKRPVPNPKSPQFPVTSIRLNRLMPEVQEVLGSRRSDLDFHPIRIKGEPLSATVLHERR